MKRLALLLLAFMLLTLPLPAFAVQGQSADLSKLQTANEAFLRKTFPKLRGMLSMRTPFVFRDAPSCMLTRATIGKSGELLILYRFESTDDLCACASMLIGSTLQYRGKTVYPATLLPTTWYVKAEENLLALYCGADWDVDRFLTRSAGFQVGGGFGGYFDERNTLDYNGYTMVAVAKLEKNATFPLSELRQAPLICVGRIESVSTRDVEWQGWPWGIYDVAVESVCMGAISGSGHIRVMIERGAVLTTGRRYVFCLDVNQFVGLYWLAGGNDSLFELGDCGNVLPVREYGMKKAVKLSSFLRAVS